MYLTKEKTRELNKLGEYSITCPHIYYMGGIYMKKENITKVIKGLIINRPLLNDLQAKANEYRDHGVEHGLDSNILFELELFQEKLTTILYLLYLGDIEKEWREKRISSKERKKRIESTICKSASPYFNFGYMNSKFIDTLEKFD